MTLFHIHNLLANVGNDVYRLNLPPYRCIYSTINIENLKLYKPFMLNRSEEDQVLPSIEDLVPNAHYQRKHFYKKKIEGLEGVNKKFGKWY